MACLTELLRIIYDRMVFQTNKASRLSCTYPAGTPDPLEAGCHSFTADFMEHLQWRRGGETAWEEGISDADFQGTL